MLVNFIMVNKHYAKAELRTYKHKDTYGLDCQLVRGEGGRSVDLFTIEKEFLHKSKSFRRTVKSTGYKKGFHKNN